MVVRWGLREVPAVLVELGAERPLLVTTPRWVTLALPSKAVFEGVRSHVPAETVDAAARLVEPCDGLLAVGGGSAIDTTKTVSARTGLPVLSVPTTYSGAEWTSGFGVRDEARGVKAGGGGARPVAIVYEPELTLSLPRAETGGTAMNALAHCAEALCARGRNEESDAHALVGARGIARALPRVLASRARGRGPLPRAAPACIAASRLAPRLPVSTVRRSRRRASTSTTSPCRFST